MVDKVSWIGYNNYMMTFKDMKTILDKMTPEQLDRVIYCESDVCTDYNVKELRFSGRTEPYLVLSPH